jgi:hypothetical protein
MKKIMNKVNFAIVSVMATMSSSFAADYTQLCNLINRLGDLLKILRIMAFIGAGFYVTLWAWEFIKAGKVDSAKVQEKGVGLLIGFVLLFAVGALLTFLIGAAAPDGALGCAQAAFAKW